MQFFQRFPAIEYHTTEMVDGSIQEIRRMVPNMTVKLKMNVFDDTSTPFHTYRVTDRDRPDTLSAQVYGAAHYAWIILLANNMRDLYDWPLSNREFDRYMARKYETSVGVADGVDVAKAIVANYRWLRLDGQILNVDKTTYDALLVSQRDVKSVYQREYDDNDQRRSIRFPTIEALDSIVQQFSAAV